MKKLDIDGISSHAWDLAKKHWLIIVSLFVSLWVVSLLINYAVESISVRTMIPNLTNIIQESNPEDIWRILEFLLKSVTLLSFFEFLVTSYFFIVILRMTFSAIRIGKLFVSAGDAFNVGFKRYVVFACVGIVTSLVYVICYGIPSIYFRFTYLSFILTHDINVSWGIVCYIIFSILFGVFLHIRLLFVSIAVATDNVGFGEAFSRSWNMTKGHFWELLLLGIEAFGIILLGFFACCVGVLFALVIVNFMLVLAYLELKGNDQMENVEEAVEVVEP